jgi:uncharacterized delta-60 repeat protein
MRTTHASHRLQDRVPSRSQRRLQAFPLAARVLLSLVALVLVGQAGATASSGTGIPFAVAVHPVAAPLSPRGAPDPGFGEGGAVVLDFFGYIDQAHAVTTQPDGKILVAGWARPDESPGVVENASGVVVRLLADGTLDTTFGNNGAAYVEGGNTYFFDLAVQPDGKIVAVGKLLVTPLSGNVLVARFDAGGTLDPTFASGGVLDLNLGGDDTAEAVALQTDGKIVVGGGSDKRFAAARLLSGGALDATFDGDGMATIPLSAGTDLASDVAIQSDDGILLAGTADRFNDWNEKDLGLVRLLPGGSLDATFDGDGKAILDLGAQDSGYGVALQTDGKIVVAGESFTPGNRVAIVVRTTGSGALDPAFGTGGVVGVGFGNAFEQLDDVAIQPDGKIVVAGNSGAGGVYDFALGRLLPGGSPDPAFDGGGGVRVDFGGDDRARAVAVQADGKILAAGDTDGDWAILRWAEAGTNTPPVLDAIGDQTVAEGQKVDVAISATDADEDPLAFALSGEPAFATLTDDKDGTATLHLAPVFDDAGVYPAVTVTVSDGVDSDSETFAITVTAVETVDLFLPLALRNH